MTFVIHCDDRGHLFLMLAPGLNFPIGLSNSGGSCYSLGDAISTANVLSAKTA